MGCLYEITPIILFCNGADARYTSVNVDNVPLCVQYKIKKSVN